MPYSLGLNMVHFHIQISEEESKLCTIVIPRGKYPNKHSSIGVRNPQNIFQQKMNNWLQGF